MLVGEFSPFVNLARGIEPDYNALDASRSM